MSEAAYTDMQMDAVRWWYGCGVTGRMVDTKAEEKREAQVRSAWKSDQGLARENNEDAVLVDEAKGIFLLADGMGGAPGGEVASLLAVTAAAELLARELPGSQSGMAGRLLAEALAAANSAVAKRALGDPSLAGMGTTLEIVLVQGAKAVVCHVGDSRVYNYREGVLRQITTDDNYAAVLAGRGYASEQIPRAYRHLLTQVVGLSDALVPEIHTIALQPEDLLLICSDGLTEVMEDSEISSFLALKPRELSCLAEALIATAIGKGGPDNISVLVVEPIEVAAGAPFLLPPPQA